MTKRVVIVFGVSCIIVVAFILMKFDLIPYTIYPTKSAPHKLLIVCCDPEYPTKPVITLKCYLNGQHISDNTLVIKNGLHLQEPQSYDLPKLENGEVEVNLELGDRMHSSFTLTYDNAKDLYEKGLLIYLDLGNHYYNNDQFVCFVSGKVTTYYGRATNDEEWSIKKEAPSLKAIPPKENPGYAIPNSGWRENKWVVNKYNS
jgi:hypothetical protein